MNKRVLRFFSSLLLLSIVVWIVAVSASLVTAKMLDAGVDGKSSLTGKAEFAEQELLVRFKSGTAKEKTKAAHDKINAKLIREFRIPSGLHKVKIPKGLSLEKAMRHYQADPDVKYVEPNYRYQALTIPNDASFSSLWGMHNTGQTGGTADADINAPEAWDLTTGSSQVVVAVIDTGVDYNHPDLAANIWTNPGEVPGNGIDDDSNGYIDDVHGINAITGTGNPLDDNNHGTHCSGTIAGAGNNAAGVAGVNWTAKIIGCKFLDSGGSGYSDDAVECLNYLYTLKTRPDNPVDIVLSSNSWGGGGYSQALYDAIDANREAGILFVAAAGNSSADTDTYTNYPSGYFLPNLIAVAATDHTDALASFSNYGRRTVHVGAPGVNVLSTTIGNTYATYSGTSMATPHVSGLAALLKAQSPTRDWKTIKNLILAGGQDKAAVSGKTITGKRIRAADAGGIGSLTCADRVVLSRLQPMASSVSAGVGTPFNLSALHINCGQPNGDVIVSVSTGTQFILTDDGIGTDQEAGDGIYSGAWLPPAEGSYTLTFPGNDVVTVNVMQNYQPAIETAYSYRTITGAALGLGDDQTATVTSPFPIHFANDPAGYTSVHISSNGTINFTAANSSYSNTGLPNASFGTLVAPHWDDLNPGAGGGVYWQVLGSAPDREFVVEWRNVPHYSYGGGATFQVVFFENSPDVLFNYADVLFGNPAGDAGASASVGVQPGSTLAQQYSFNAPLLRNNLALLWRMASLVANAGPDQFVLPSAAAALDGNGSRGGAGGITGYAWVQTAGAPVVLTGADTPTPSFTAPDIFGTLTFQLTVTGSDSNTASDTVDVIVNLPPTANAGPDQTAIANFAVSLDGTGSSDANGIIAGYQWVQTSGQPVTLSNGSTATPSFTAPNTVTNAPGTLTFRLTVADDAGQKASDTVNVLVLTPPVADAGSDRFAAPLSAVALNGTGSHDQDGTIVSYSWVQTAGEPVVLSGAATPTPGFTAPGSGSTLTFLLTVTDNDGLSSNDTVSVVVSVVPTANAGTDQTAVSGTLVTLDGSASYDPDGTIAGYSWAVISGPTVTLTNPATAAPSFSAPYSPGTITFRLTVLDNSGQAATDDVSVAILTPPTANAGPDQKVQVGASVTLNGAGSFDPDGTITTYLWEQIAGTPVTLSGAGTATAGFVAPATVGSSTFRLTVTDNMGYSSSDTIVIQTYEVYLPPVATNYEYRVITGTRLSLTDDSVATMTSPFPVHFAGDPAGFTTMNISSNGNISFSTVNATLSNTTLPTTAFGNLVAPFWDDLNPGVGGGVYWQEVGTAPDRELVVEWRDVPSYSCGGAAKFQVVFFENNPGILFNYADVIFGGTSCDAGVSATVGVQVSSTLARQYSYNAPALANMQALLWRTSTQLVANAGPDQFALPNSAVALDGAGSSDPNGAIISYSWSQVSGTLVTLSGAGTPMPSFTAPDGNHTLLFRLTVTDDSGERASDLVQVIVNTPPVPNAGPDQAVTAGAGAALNGTGSYDPDGTIVSYAWAQTAGTSVTLTGANTATPVFTAPSVPGTLTFRLTVTDNNGLTAFDTVNVLVRMPPVSNAGADQFAQPGVQVALNGTGSHDPDGAIVSYAWTQTVGAPVTLTGADTATPSFTAPSLSGTLTFQLIVTDDNGLSGSDTVNVMVNQLPVADAGPDQTVFLSTGVTLSGAGSYDPDGAIASYAWVQTAGTSVTLTGANTATPSFTTPATPGGLTFRLTIIDSSGQGSSDSVTIVVVAGPRANAGPDSVIATGQTPTLTGTGSYDPDGTIVSYAWAQTAGTPVTLTGADTATPGFIAPSLPGTLTFQLIVTDNSGYQGSDTVNIIIVDNYHQPVETAFAYRVITGTALALTDDSVAAITSPFPVRFPANPAGYTTVYVSSNGNISFTGSNPSFSNTGLPTTSFSTLVAPFWDDLNPGVGGGVYWQMVGTAPNRELVIEWRDVPSYSCGGAAKFQVVFFENNPGILFNYADVIFGSTSCDAGASATVGVQIAPTLARQYSLNTAALRNNLALLWKQNFEPVANGGADQWVIAGSTVTLDGTGSTDPDGSTLAYAWTQLAGTPVTLTGADTATPAFTAPDVLETLVFQLTVTDDRGAAVSDSVDVTIHLPPIANAGPDQIVLPNTVVTLNGAGSSDPDGTIASYSWTQESGTAVALTGADTATPGFTSPDVPGNLTFRLAVRDNRGASASAFVTVLVNLPPAANSGPDQIVLSNAVVALTGAGSSDPDGTIASFAWTQTAGTAVVLSGADTAAPGFTAPNASVTLTFQLTVTDNRGATASDTVNVTVNLPPAADAGADKLVLANAAVTLTGSGTDPDGTIASYAWVQTAGTTVALSGANTATPGFTAPNASETLTFQLTVTDNRGATASDTVNVTVNLPPAADAGADKIVLANAAVALTGSGIDPDGTISSFAWTQTAGTTVVLTGADTATPGFTAPNASETLTFQLTVTDNRGATASDTVNVTVNLPPAADAGADKLVIANAAVTLTGSGTDPDGTIASYAWTQTSGTTVLLTGANTATPGFTAPNASETLTFQLTITDNRGAIASDMVNVTINLPPIANAGPDQTVRTRAAVVLNGSGSGDPDGTIASYNWVQTQGTSIVLTGANTASPSFTAPNSTTTLVFRLTVTDNRGATADDAVTVVVSRK